MKFWQKIYLFALLLVIFTISITGIILVQNLHNKLMESEIDKDISEQQLLVRELQLESLYYDNYMQMNVLKTERSLDMILQDYKLAMPYQGKFQVLDLNGNVLFSDPDFPSYLCQEALTDLTFSDTKLIIKDTVDKKYVFIGSLTHHRNEAIQIYYAKDITSIYIQKKGNYFFFVKLAIWIYFIFSVFMFFISRMMTTPIEKLMLTTQRIAAGNYIERAEIHSKDEFGQLACQFNQMAQTIEDKIKQLELSNEQKETFIHNFTHELKTPLTSIIGYADLIRTSKYDEALFFEAADFIYNEGKHLEQIAFKMMELIYSNSHQLQLESINVQTLMEELQKTFKARLEKKQLHFHTELSANEIAGDPILIKMLLSNLIDNAIKACYENGSIQVSCTKATHQTIISIQDTGMGIAKEHLDKIFEPFYIVDPARTKKNNGAGIGLAICQKITELHHAKLEVKTELNVGTTISILFDD